MSLKKVFKTMIWSIPLLLCGCNLSNVDETLANPEYAFPLINSEISIEDFLNLSDEVEVKENDEGNLVIVYSTSILEETLNEILPSIPGVGEIPLLDTSNIIPLDFANDIQLKKAILDGDQLRFRFAASIPEDIHIMVTIPELEKNGTPLNVPFTLEYQGELPFTAFSDIIDLQGYEYTSDNNTLSVVYDARKMNGERIILDLVTLSFNEILFSYGEGNIGRSIYPLTGSGIPVNIYSAWEQGVLEFDDPTVHFTMDHSFGFPISVLITSLNVKTINNENKILEGEYVNQELPLEYLKIGEEVESKLTSIVFDKNNSNINTVFNEKVSNISFNVNAIINPTGDPNLIGFLTNKSYFKLDADLNVPLKLRINDLVLKDTLEIQDLPEIPADTATFKIVMANKYPLGGSFSLTLLDENNSVLIRLFESEGLEVPAGVIHPDGSVSISDEMVRYLPLNEGEINLLDEAKKAVLTMKFSNHEEVNFVNIKRDQFIDLRIGVKFQI